MDNDKQIQQCFPALENHRLKGLYLRQDIRAQDAPFVYTNYITSLDGRIALEHPETGQSKVPGHIANDRDWRLFQELAAQADALIASARYARELAQGTAQDQMPVSAEGEYDDLRQWRREQGLAEQPAFVIVSASLDIPESVIRGNPQRDIYIATGKGCDADKRDRLQAAGAKFLYVGTGRWVDGKRLIEALTDKGFEYIYAISGPDLLETLLGDQVLNRLYLTQMNRLLGGKAFDTLLDSPVFEPPVDCHLKELYFDPHGKPEVGQMFCVYDLSY